MAATTATAAAATRLPVVFTNHGGGPSFLMPRKSGSPSVFDRIDSQSDLANFLRGLLKNKAVFPQPDAVKAVLVISAHYEEDPGADDDQYFLSTGAPKGKQPTLLYDYYGFPAECYNLTWRRAAAWDDALVQRTKAVFAAAGLKLQVEANRGFDHGVFVPLMQILPDEKDKAAMPIAQVSLQTHLSAKNHFALGRALAPLREEGVLIYCSGALTHNLRLLMSGPLPGPVIEKLSAFHDFVVDAATKKTGEERERLMVNSKQKAPNFALAHPREEHFIPFVVAAGAADPDKPARIIFEDWMNGMDLTCYAFD